jgi:hypothetical protein
MKSFAVFVWDTAFIIGALALALWAAPQHAHYGHHALVLLPDSQVTPGEVRTTDVNEVCHGGSTRQYRHTTSAEKKKDCTMYGLIACPHEGTLELDHLIPLELGGADVIANLWPQPANPKPGFHEKDVLENYLHDQVCAGKMALIDAQAAIRTDWAQAYADMKGWK